nr:uncharacterized protein LOC109732054 isoform X6 [Aegilops tauschii subsp. strangulata]
MISLLRLVTTSFLILYVKCHKLILRLCVLFLSLIIFQVQGLQYHLDILKSENLISPNWKDFDVSKWKIVEQLQQPIQKDSSSCGLFMLKFMEYWTGYALSYPITQGTVWLSYYPLHVYMGRWKTAFTISKGWIRTQGTNFGTSSNIRGQ